MTLVEALQAALAAEHVAVYAYGVVGGQLHGHAQLGAATNAYDTHRARRAALRELIEAAHTVPVPAASAYDLGGPVTTVGAARALAGRVERGAGAAYADLVAPAQGELRTSVAAWLTDSALRGLTWGLPAQSFPGLTERTG
jgi:hypothetical protein